MFLYYIYNLRSNKILELVKQILPEILNVTMCHTEQLYIYRPKFHVAIGFFNFFNVDTVNHNYSQIVRDL